jgi:hypothetical protein
MSENFKRYLNCYEWETVLPGSGAKIKYKPITTGQIKRLLLYEDMDDAVAIENAMDNLVTECVITEGFNIKDLFLQDRFFLTVEIRNVTKGNKYTFPSTCMECGSQTFQTVDLAKLPVKKLKKDDITIKLPIQEAQPKKKGKLTVVETKPETEKTSVKKEEIKPWNYIKINDNIGITVKLITRKLQEAVMTSLQDKTLTDEQRLVEVNLLSYAGAIESIITPAGVETDITFEDKIFFINKLIPSEKEKIDEWYISHDFGIDFKFKVKCIHCGNEAERVIPLENFFY